jgi:predicted RND superfamily exporter protein
MAIFLLLANISVILFLALFFYQTGDVYESIKETLLGTGRALLVTSVVLIISFLCLLCATLEIYARFGFFTAIVILLALLADFILAPALLTVVIPSKKTI